MYYLILSLLHPVLIKQFARVIESEGLHNKLLF